MEFLDDLRSQAEPEDEPEETPAGEEGQEGDAWEDLLTGVSFDEPEEQGREQQRRRAGFKLNLNKKQKIILGVLGVVVIGVWAVIILLISRAMRTPATPAPDGENAEVTVVSYADVTPGATGSVTPAVTTTPAEDEAGGETDAGPTATATPDVTPTPPPPVFTSYDRQIQNDPDNVDLYLQRGYEYLSLGAHQAALEDFEKAISLEEKEAQAYVGLGWAHFYMGHWNAAEDDFGTAVALNQDLSEAHFGLGKLHYYSGSYEKAADEFDWAAEINRENAEAEAWLGIASARQGEIEEAFGAVSRAISITDAIPIVYIAQSWARRIEEPPDIDGAQADLLYARELSPNDFLTLNALASFYVDYRPERVAEAEQLAAYAHNWAENTVEQAVALQTLGRVYLKQDRQDAALEVFTDAARLVGGDGEILLAGLEEDMERAQ